ncbi:MAG: ABC transporter permease [Dehalococcoidia bacterium]|nr:ABC transporter permease [Dehalococcoidia bacterium]
MRWIGLVTLRGQRLGLALLALGLFGFSVLIVGTYETFGTAISDFMRSLPPAFQSLLRAQGGLVDTPNGYIAIGYRHPVFLVILSGFVISAASGALAREIERGTAFLLLARPLARWRLVAAKALAMTVALAALLGVSLGGTWAGARVYGVEGVDYGALALVTGNAFLLGLALGGVAFLLSALSSDGGSAMGMAAGIVVALYFVDFMASLWGAIGFLGPASLFYYYDPIAVAEGGHLRALDVVVLGVVALVSFTVALVAFQRRDLA